MARGKQNEGSKKDGKHRKESKEEKKARLESTQQAREACEKLVPYALGFVVLLLIVFAGYVQSVPPREIVPPVVPGAAVPLPQDNIQMDPMVKQALDEANAALKEQAKANSEAKAVPPESETVEL
eukprot:CAMPEP_0119009756 /NCGR_PEP_ID=MMETSP1176-20130426/4586_1 /TAXON_ID=265551 /ORGANISM="Synedropsis recta cf, Strain CCMP1620" /LENGTH=124 /DNA_ID=CAMNT_0006962329 /DNA_START=116 /DNA_END=490 /DNA_ORIENTATION=-